MHNIILLAIEYFKIGCISIGGGLTVVPFLYYFVDKYQWYTTNDITQMLAISNLTPGPIGINMATYVGLKVGGIASATITTIAFMIPSFIIMCVISKFLKHNKENKCINCILDSLKPAAVALIAVTGFKILNETVLTYNKFLISKNIGDILSLKSLIFLLIFVTIGLRLKKQPMWLILIALICGIITNFIFK